MSNAVIEQFLSKAKQFSLPYSPDHVRSTLARSGRGERLDGTTPSPEQLMEAKLLSVFQAFRSFRTGQAIIDHLPVEYHLEHTDRCNLACSMCMAHHGRDESTAAFDDMDFRLIERLATYLDAALVGRIAGQGEPMLSRDFMPIVRLFKRWLCYLTTTTNATLLTAERARELVELRFDTLIISIDSPVRETYERIRTNANYDKTIANIRRLVEIRHAAGSPCPGIVFSMVAMQQNLAELPQMLELMDRLGVGTLKIVPMSFPPPSTNPRMDAYRETFAREAVSYLDPDQVADEIARTRQRARELGIGIQCSEKALTTRPPAHLLEVTRSEPAAEQAARPAAPRQRNRGRSITVADIESYASTAELPVEPAYCAWPWLLLHVRQDGRAAVCCKAADLVTGDLNTQSVAEVFHGEAMTAFRSAIAAGRFPARSCENCYLRGQPASFDYIFWNLAALVRANADRLHPRTTSPRRAGSQPPP